MENPEGQPQPPVMMSLLDKYSNMDTKMDQVRQETAEVELEIQRRQTNTEELLEEREHMKTLQERTLQQQRDLTNEAEKAILKLHEVAEERAQAETKRDEAQARLDRIKKRSNEYREQFLHSSRTFRSQCKRRKMTSQTLGVPNEALAAYSYVTWPQLVQAFEEPEDGRDASDELKYSQTKDKFRELEKSHAESKRECDEWMAKKEGLAERANKRKTQKANLQAQLNRLLQDIRNIQGQLQVARTEASERSNDLVQAPITGHSNNALQQATGIRNPYARPNRFPPPVTPSNKSSTGTNRGSTSIASHNRTSSNAVGNDTVATASRTAQYPHRVGRLRTSRDFGLSIRMDDDDSEESEDELLSYVAFRK